MAENTEKRIDCTLEDIVIATNQSKTRQEQTEEDDLGISKYI